MFPTKRLLLSLGIYVDSLDLFQHNANCTGEEQKHNLHRSLPWFFVLGFFTWKRVIPEVKFDFLVCSIKYLIFSIRRFTDRGVIRSTQKRQLTIPRDLIWELSLRIICLHQEKEKYLSLRCISSFGIFCNYNNIYICVL